EILHVGVSRGAVQVEVVFLHVLPVIPLAVREPEQALFQDRVLAVPQREGKTEGLLVVGDPRQAVFTPPIGPGPSLIVGEVVPGIPVVAVVLADGAPLTFTQVRPPLLPGGVPR